MLPVDIAETFLSPTPFACTHHCLLYVVVVFVVVVVA